MLTIKTTEFKNKDQLTIHFNDGKFYGFDSKVNYIEVVYGEYNQGNYADASAEGHYFMSAMSRYFPLNKLDEAMEYFRLIETFYRNTEDSCLMSDPNTDKLYGEFQEKAKKFGYSLDEVNKMNIEYLA